MLHARERFAGLSAPEGSVGAVAVQILAETAGVLEQFLPDDNRGQQVMQHLELAAQRAASDLGDVEVPEGAGDSVPAEDTQDAEAKDAPKAKRKEGDGAASGK